jgi:hypothetical protein
MFTLTSGFLNNKKQMAKTCLREKTPPRLRLGHLAPASEVTGGHFKKGQRMVMSAILKW